MSDPDARAREEVLQGLHDWLSNRERPSCHEAVADDYQGDSLAAKYVNYFRSATVEQLWNAPVSSIRVYHGAMFFMEDDELIYYLPIFVASAVRDALESGEMYDAIVGFPLQRAELRTLATPDEVRLICRFVLELASHLDFDERVKVHATWCAEKRPHEPSASGASRDSSEDRAAFLLDLGILDDSSLELVYVPPKDRPRVVDIFSKDRPREE